LRHSREIWKLKRGQLRIYDTSKMFSTGYVLTVVVNRGRGEGGGVGTFEQNVFYGVRTNCGVNRGRGERGRVGTFKQDVLYGVRTVFKPIL